MWPIKKLKKLFVFVWSKYYSLTSAFDEGKTLPKWHGPPWTNMFADGYNKRYNVEETQNPKHEEKFKNVGKDVSLSLLMPFWR